MEEKAKIPAMVGRVERLQAVADTLLGRIGEELAEAARPGEKRYKEIADTLKVIRDIQLIRPEADLREQEARIQSMEKRAAGEEAAPATVEIEVKGAEEWLV